MRIWRHLDTLFASAGASECLALRLPRRPGALSVGPWSWRPQPGDQIELNPAQCPGTLPTGDTQPWFSRSDEASGALPLFLSLQEVMALLWKGLPQDAQTLLDHEARWCDAAPALVALLCLLRGQVLTQLRQFSPARESLRHAGVEATHAPHALAFLQGHVALAEARLDYAEHPEEAYTGLLMRLPDLLQGPVAMADPAIRAEALNLQGLCQRRELEAEGTSLDGPGREARLHAMQRSFLAALFLLTAARQFERAQCACSNLAYAYQQVAPLFTPSMFGLAMQWHGAATRMHTTFDLSFSSAWEYIFIGELWLRSATGRAAAQALSSEFNWQGQRPDRLRFYEDGVKAAQGTADPRQQAHALINLHQFAALRKLAPAQAQALEALRAVLQRAPDLVGVLRAEGCRLPRAARA